MAERTQKFNWFVMFWDGLKNMTTLGKTLWILVIIKLCIMFLILKPFFFPSFLSQFGSKENKADYVKQVLIEKAK